MSGLIGRALGSRRAPMVAGGLVAVLAGLALLSTHHAPRSVIPARRAVQIALRDAGTRQALIGSHWTSARADPLDDRTERVSFFAGARLVAHVALERDGTVIARVDDAAMPVPYGNSLAYQPALIVGLCALFALMTAVTPWRALRNLDVAACLSFVAPVLLFRHDYIGASVLAALPGLGYLLLRCVFTAFGPGREPVSQIPLIDAITPRLTPSRRTRWLRALLVALALGFLMIAIGSPAAADVTYAVIEGATRIVHGVLPYGHLPPGVVHGDTYPILSYALYTPIALVAPVNSTWDSVDAGLGVAALIALATAWAMQGAFAGPRCSAAAGRRPEAEEAGLRAALAWLAFPPLLITASTGTTDVMLAAMLVGALLLWRWPAACSGMLAFGGWFKLAPFALLPVCLARLRGRRLAGALTAVLAASLPPVALLLALGGLHGPAAMVQAMSFQFSRGSLQSVWSVLGIGTLQPLAQGCVVGLIAAAVLKLRREGDLARDRARMAALAAAILLGLQLTADYWAFLYLVWVTPLIGFSLLAERAVTVQPAEAPQPAALDAEAPTW